MEPKAETLMQVTLLAPLYWAPTPWSLLAVRVGGLEDRGSNFKKARLLADSFFILFCRLWPLEYLLAYPAEPRDRRGVQH